MHVVTPNSHDSYNNPEPSPDGARMAYMRWHVDGVKMAIYVSSADGSDAASRLAGPAGGLAAGLVADGRADRVRELRLHGSSRAVVVHGAPDRRGPPGAHASAVPARGLRAGVLPGRPAGHLRVRPAVRRLLLPRPVRRPGIGRHPEAGAPAVRRVRSPLGNRADAARDELAPVRDAALHGRRATVRLRSGAGGHRSVRPTHGYRP